MHLFDGQLLIHGILSACAVPEAGDISTLMPAVFAECLLRVYTRDSQ